MIVKIHVVVFWLMILRSLIDGHWHFGGTYCLHLKGRVNHVGKVVCYMGAESKINGSWRMCVMRAMN
jgi:hypothetical protein